MFYNFGIYLLNVIAVINLQCSYFLPTQNSFSYQMAEKYNKETGKYKQTSGILSYITDWINPNEMQLKIEVLQNGKK